LSRDDLLEPGFWRRFAPQFHIADRGFLVTESVALPNGDLGGDINREGYIHLHDVNRNDDFAAMAGLARKLSAAGLEPVFAFVYDEFWRPFFRLDALYRRLLGPYTFLPALWAWDVDPKRGGAGWGPHRDRGAMALLPDGSPKSVTTWIPLSEATPLNGCLYIVPAQLDPTYNTADEANWRFDHASIRALPAKPGDVLMWNQAVMHWGGKSSPHGTESRVSLSLEAQRLDVPSTEEPLIAPGEVLPFEARLKLIAQKILHYKHMSAIAPEMEAIATHIVEKLA
jgi:hypothetical protein